MLWGRRHHQAHYTTNNPSWTTSVSRLYILLRTADSPPAQRSASLPAQVLHSKAWRHITKGKEIAMPFRVVTACDICLPTTCTSLSRRVRYPSALS